VPELDTSVFLLPEEITKNGVERIVVLNCIARIVLESQRYRHREVVFAYKGDSIPRMNNHAWREARRRTSLAKVRVHDLRHATASSRCQLRGPSGSLRMYVVNVFRTAGSVM